MTRSVALLALLALAGCGGDDESLVMVALTATAPLTGIEKLDVATTVGSSTHRIAIAPAGGLSTIGEGAEQRFGIRLPAGVRGSIWVAVDAVTGGRVVAHGEAGGTIGGGRPLELSLVLQSSAPPPPMGGDMALPPSGSLTSDLPAFDFGALTVGKTSPALRIQIRNQGPQAVSPVFSASGPELDQFSIVEECTTLLPAGSGCVVSVAFAPTSAGMKSARFALDAGAGGHVLVSLRGDGIAPAALVVSAEAPANGDCGAVLIGSASPTRATYTIKNGGTVTTSPLALATNGPAFSHSGCQGATLAPQQTCAVTVTFTPTMRGQQVGSLTVSATPGGTASESVQGRGLAAAAFTFTSSAGSFYLGSAARAGSAGTVTIGARNSGDVDSPPVSAATLSGVDATSFKVTNDDCAAKAIAAGATCNVTVKLTPVVSGPLTAVLALVAGATVLGSVELSGTGSPVWTPEATNVFHLGPLYVVRGAADGQLFAAGPGYLPAGSSFTLIGRNLAGAWKPLTHAGTSHVTMMAVSAPDNVWIADDQGIYSWTGTAFSKDTRPGAPTARIAGIYTFGADDVWAALTTGAIVHYRGGSWAAEASPPAGGGGFFGSSDDDLFTFGTTSDTSFDYAKILHRGSDGKWTTVYTSTGAYTMAGYTARVTALFGFGNPITSAYATVTNTMAPTPPIHAGSDGLWAPITNTPAGVVNCSDAFGVDEKTMWFLCNGAIYSYDGTTWSAPLTIANARFQSLWGTSATNLYAVGFDSSAINGVVYHLY
jgi:hypothetical protein